VSHKWLGAFVPSKILQVRSLFLPPHIPKHDSLPKMARQEKPLLFLAVILLLQQTLIQALALSVAHYLIFCQTISELKV